jgi:hypothetical protein
MADMLRKRASHAFGCCDHCARKKKAGNKPDKRERHLARAIEKREWRNEARTDWPDFARAPLV